MIVGKAWKARIKPSEPSSPGPLAKAPKANSLPLAAQSNIFTTNSLTAKKNLLPVGIINMKVANEN